MAFLDQILERKKIELAEAKQLRSLQVLKGLIRDAPPPLSFSSSIARGFGLIAEIKRKSPSGGEMPAKNVEAAPTAYASSPAVRAVSVLTNAADFGMSIEELTRIKAMVGKPVLRKDFIFEEYQVYEARAFGADAVLLMANVLDRERLKRLFLISQQLQMDVLFEAHTREEIESLPQGAKICGINSRKFKASARWTLNKVLLALGFGQGADAPDLSVDLETFSLIQHLPREAIKVAESGLKPASIPKLIDMGYNAVLVGASLLKAPQGIDKMLAEFERVIAAASEG
jgi:indole-3-glycerol phosphate synthase